MYRAVDQRPPQDPDPFYRKNQVDQPEICRPKHQEEAQVGLVLLKGSREQFQGQPVMYKHNNSISFRYF
jgi:hypothetical protein